MTAQRNIPQTLIVCLAEAAARHQKWNSLANLIEVWPLPCLNLSKLRQRGIEHVMNGVNDAVKQTIREDGEMVITLLNKLTKIMKTGNLPNSLETLDISGFPLIFSRLVDLLRGFAENRTKRKDLLTLRVDLYLTDKECWQLNRERQLPMCGVKVSVRQVFFNIVSHTSTLSWKEEYLACLTKLKTTWHHVFDFSSTSGIEIARLDIRSFFAASTTVEDRNTGIRFLSDLANTFDHVDTLDLSYNAINLNGSPSTCEVIGQFLSHLGRGSRGLIRLDLSGNRLTNQLSSLLQHTPNLRYLNLTGTQLRNLDISCLSQLRSLQHLDLSCCALQNKLNALLGLFGILSELRILEMVDSNLEQTHLDALIPGLHLLENLKLLNISYNPINPVENVESLKCKVLMDPYEEVPIEFHGENHLAVIDY